MKIVCCNKINEELLLFALILNFPLRAMLYILMTSACRGGVAAASSTAATGSNLTAYQTTMNNNSRINKRG